MSSDHFESQDASEQREWEKPSNWSGWFGSYSSPRDSRLRVPKRPMTGSGWTLNFAHPRARTTLAAMFVVPASFLLLFVLVRLQARAVDELIVMTSGTFTAAHLELAPEFERTAKTTVTTATTSMGVGAESIPNRLKSGQAADVVIVADDALTDLIENGLIVADSRTELAKSSIGMAVRAGAPKPDISTVAALTSALVNAKSLALSSSVSGDYFTDELFPRLGIADRMAGKTRRSGGERVGALIARGEAEIGFQQMSELRPVAGIDVVGPLPPEVQRVTVFAAGVAVNSKHPEAARAYIRFLASPAASKTIARSGLER